MKPKFVEMNVRDKERVPIPIVADAAVSTRGIHGGRILPLLLLDTSERPELREFIHVQSKMVPGDVNFNWGKLERNDDKIALFLTFVRPIEFFAIIEFEIVRQGIFVEQALTGEGIYIANSKDSTDRLIYDFDRPKVIIELPDTGFRGYWNRIFQKCLAKHFRSEGLGWFESKKASKSAIEQLRQFSDMRMKDILPGLDAEISSQENESDYTRS